MIYFFGNEKTKVFGVQTNQELSHENIEKLNWLFGGVTLINKSVVADFFIGPRAAMITPWSTNAVEITQNMGIKGIVRIEEFQHSTENYSDFDPMISQKYTALTQEMFTVSVVPEEILYVADIAAYNKKEGLSLSDEEVDYLKNVA